MLEQKLNELKLTNVLLTRKKGKFVSKVPLIIDVLIELYGIITQWHSLLHMILLNVKILSHILIVQKTKYRTIYIAIKLSHY